MCFYLLLVSDSESTTAVFDDKLVIPVPDEPTESIYGESYEGTLEN